MKYKIKLLIKNKQENSDAEYIINNPQLKNNLIRLGLFGDNEVCFNYALNTPDFDYCEDAYEFLVDYCKQVKNKEIKENDIIVYFGEGIYDIKHFAKVYKTNGTIKNTIIRSKWGQLGVYETSISGIPDIYGDEIEIWREKNE